MADSASKGSLIEELREREESETVSAKSCALASLVSKRRGRVADALQEEKEALCHEAVASELLEVISIAEDKL